MKTSIMILLLAVSSLSVYVANAQARVGVKAGLNIANLSGFEGNSRVSGHAGLFLHHTINENWCFQPELLYSGEGQRYFDQDGERTIALGYIQVPMMIQYYPSSQLYFEAGPQVGVLISAEDKSVNEVGHLNVKDEFSAAQIALGVGLGYKFTNNLSIYGRYNFGLTDVTKFDNVVDHSRVGQIGLAVRLK
jgi:hypothetical protein